MDRTGGPVESDGPTKHIHTEMLLQKFRLLVGTTVGKDAAAESEGQTLTYLKVHDWVFLHNFLPEIIAKLRPSLSSSCMFAARCYSAACSLFHFDQDQLVKVV
jgi:hypothetical protein